MYEYKCKKCSIEITVLRNFNDYQIEPKEVELEEEKKPKACGEVNHDWERLIGGSIRAVRGPGWRGMKGSWLIPLIFSLLTGCVTPEYWSASEHRRTMLQCRTMCQKEAKEYEPLTGTCTCQVPHGPK